MRVTPPRKPPTRAQPWSSGGDLFVLGCFIIVCLGMVAMQCGDAYSTIVPRQKTSTQMKLSPDFARLGDTFELHVVVFTPHQNNYVHDFDFGAGIDLVAYDSGTGQGCAQVVTETISVPDLFEPTYLYPLCFTMVVQSTATLGERSFIIEVESGDTPLVARADFYVLPSR